MRITNRSVLLQCALHATQQCDAMSRHHQRFPCISRLFDTSKECKKPTELCVQPLQYKSVQLAPRYGSCIWPHLPVTPKMGNGCGGSVPLLFVMLPLLRQLPVLSNRDALPEVTESKMWWTTYRRRELPMILLSPAHQVWCGTQPSCRRLCPGPTISLTMAHGSMRVQASDTDFASQAWSFSAKLRLIFPCNATASASSTMPEEIFGVSAFPTNITPLLARFLLPKSQTRCLLSSKDVLFKHSRSCQQALAEI